MNSYFSQRASFQNHQNNSHTSHHKFEQDISNNLHQLSLLLKHHNSPSPSLSLSNSSIDLEQEIKNTQLRKIETNILQKIETFLDDYENPYKMFLALPHLIEEEQVYKSQLKRNVGQKNHTQIRISDLVYERSSSKAENRSEESNIMIWKCTDFIQEIHCSLNLYLNTRTCFLPMKTHYKAIVDGFYLFILAEYPEAYKKWMINSTKRIKNIEHEHKQQWQYNKEQMLEMQKTAGVEFQKDEDDRKGLCIGEWFYLECIYNFLQRMYRNKKQYTFCVRMFMRYGLSFLFLVAVRYLQDGFVLVRLQEKSIKELERIRVCYVNKYDLQ